MNFCEVKSFTIYYQNRSSEKKTVFFTLEDLNSGEIFVGIAVNENLPSDICDILDRNLFVQRSEKPLEKKGFFTKFNQTTKSFEKISIDQYHIKKIGNLNDYCKYQEDLKKEKKDK